MAKICIVDDNLRMQDKVRRIVNQSLVDSTYDYTISTFNAGHSFLEYVAQQRVDLVLLDIELGNENGVDVARHLSDKQPNAVVIFITSYEGYIRDAFGLNVFDYILKEDLDTQLPKTLINLDKYAEARKDLSFVFDSGVVNIEADACRCIEYKDRSVTFHLEYKDITIKSVSLTKVFEQCPKSLFIQPNSRYIINMKYIAEMRKGVIKIKDCPEPIEVSRGNFRKLYQTYLDYLMAGGQL